MTINQVLKHISGHPQSRIAQMICGEKIGGGQFRDVYVLKQNPKYVVKIERAGVELGGDFPNACEWRNYINNKEWKWFEQWLAPCEFINVTGRILVMQRVEHRPRKEYPTHIPSIFTDTKVTNFGFIGDRFCCCDYSYLLVGLGMKKMKRAKWWGKFK